MLTSRRRGELLEVVIFASIDGSESAVIKHDSDPAISLTSIFPIHWTDRCGPCRMIAPKFEEMSKEYPGAIFVKVDVDDRSDIAEEFGINCMPTFIAYVGGEIKEKMEGADKDGLLAMIAKYAK